ncbi:hypothetical protein PFICI_12969 [Pestalotiopsis fici W106-1]|uniref:RRM domain-containing protein n=1 Tax=Pestalotiopsis fici (strain W106-1 / CGMCC3.15140) TaxID=1229662 RepID=W3WQ60_PESFW|nr:uncharacterized protein PFICI_12969 [Pestalotiopsis fici W106-1]ETS76025.1 hypothetical protein PFICI_12969 [Pestalotiopsis fici W106-1]
MASITDPVTIDRAYFDTLVRRANCNDGPLSAAMADQNLTVVPKADYDNLLQLAHQYTTLCANLISGGIDEQTIVVLSQDNTSRHSQEMIGKTSRMPMPTGNKTHSLNQTKEHGTHFSPATKIYSTHYKEYSAGNGRNGYSSQNGYSGYNGSAGWADGPEEDFSAEYSPDGSSPGAQQEPNFSQALAYERPHYPRMCKRTVVLAGLAEGTTHGDVTNVVRGGMVLEIYLRAADHSALVSFLLEEDAVSFYEHVRRNDLYINHKRVFVKWADRHFHLAGHVAGKIGQGATRNMIIRRCGPDHTVDSIRDHLEHIHNLVVISIDFIGSSCYIKTNSVHNAMFARTCMMSRVTYKGSKIEWDVDECAQPLEVSRKPSVPKPLQSLATKPPGVKIRNRFATLRLDDDDNGDSDDRLDTSTEFAAFSTVGVGA